MKKITCKKLKAFAKEEKHSAKEYAELGFKKIASEEAEHSRYFKGLAKKYKK